MNIAIAAMLAMATFWALALMANTNAEPHIVAKKSVRKYTKNLPTTTWKPVFRQRILRSDYDFSSDVARYVYVLVRRCVGSKLDKKA